MFYTKEPTANNILAMQSSCFSSKFANRVSEMKKIKARQKKPFQSHIIDISSTLSDLEIFSRFFLFFCDDFWFLKQKMTIK